MTIGLRENNNQVIGVSVFNKSRVHDEIESNQFIILLASMENDMDFASIIISTIIWIVNVTEIVKPIRPNIKSKSFRPV